MQIDGQTYPLQFGVNAMATAEELIGGEIAHRIKEFRVFRALFWAALLVGSEEKGHEFTVDILQAGRLIDKTTLQQRKEFWDSFMESHPKEDKQPGKKK